jgi:preflagellin peptidase FlaK
VETEEILGLSAFIITIAVLVSASVGDWKKREVSNVHWAVLGAAALALTFTLSIYLTGFRWEYIFLAAGTVMILIDILWDKEFNPLIFYGAMAVLFVVPLFPNISEDIMLAWASVPLCFIFYVGLYYAGIIRGGADVKCLIALSIMFPIYPQFLGLPLISIPNNFFPLLFVCSVSIMFIAALMVTPLVLYFIAKNAKKKKKKKRTFTGYRMEISEAERSSVWPLEDIVDGNLVSTKIPKDDDTAEVYSRLREAGREDVWVTPMIPFVIMITAATAFVILIGSPLFLTF